MTKKIITLNTANNCDYKKNGSKNIEFIFDVPGMEVNQGAKIRVINVCHQGAQTNNKTTYIFKLKDIMINYSYYYGNDGSYPTIFSANLADNVPNFNLGSQLTLNKQSINFINLQVTDDMTNINSGIIDTVYFIIVLEIEE